MRIARWIPKATNTHTRRICNTHCFPTTTTITRTSLNVTLYVHCRSGCFLNFTLFPQVGIDMIEFPEFRSELHFVEQMVTEESVFCLPSKVGKVSLLRPAVGSSCYLLPALVTIKPKLSACDLT